MAYWYTYPAYSSSDEEDDDNIQKYIYQKNKAFQKLIDTEYHWWEGLQTYLQFEFHPVSNPKPHYSYELQMCQPIETWDSMYFLSKELDIDTFIQASNMLDIKTNKNNPPSYYGRITLNDETLQTIFQMAHEWCIFHDMYTKEDHHWNDICICWVSYKIIRILV